MRILITTLGLLLSSLSFHLAAQSSVPDTARWFDFWVGKWAVTWTEGDSTGSGTNEISWTLDSTVLQENFRILRGASAGFKGTSISVYAPRRKTWHQAWADNQGGYYNFVGAIDGNRRIFQTQPQQLPNGQARVLRMVFRDITPAAMTWDWEASTDGGSSWRLIWQINYKRIGP